jgi:hypothetical protein
MASSTKWTRNERAIEHVFCQVQWVIGRGIPFPSPIAAKPWSVDGLAPVNGCDKIVRRVPTDGRRNEAGMAGRDAAALRAST